MQAKIIVTIIIGITDRIDIVIGLRHFTQQGEDFITLPMFIEQEEIIISIIIDLTVVYHHIDGIENNCIILFTFLIINGIIYSR
jgi:hypothetical protein